MRKQAAGRPGRVARPFATLGSLRGRCRRQTAELLRGPQVPLGGTCSVPPPYPLRGLTPAPAPEPCDGVGAARIVIGECEGASGSSHGRRSRASASSLVSGQMISTSTPGHAARPSRRPDQTGHDPSKMALGLVSATAHPAPELRQLGAGGPSDGRLPFGRARPRSRGASPRPPSSGSSTSGADPLRERREPPILPGRRHSAVKRPRRCSAALRPKWVTAERGRARSTPRAVRLHSGLS